MDPFDRHQLDLLIASQAGPHLSIFLPAPANPLDTRDDAIRLSNLVREAHQTLTEHWMRKGEADDFLKPLSDLQRESEFIARRDHGVAIYLCDAFRKVYPTTESVEERLHIAKTFRVRPMLATMASLTQFFLLTVSKKRIRLYSATPWNIREVELAGLEGSFEESMAQVSADRGAQTHSAATGVTGKQGAVFHGQGGAPDAEKAEIVEYLRQIENTVSSYLQDKSGFLILAGVDYLTAIYDQVNHCPRVVAETISGNVDHLSPDELLQRAMPIALEQSRRERETDAERVREQRRDQVVTDSEQVLCAAYEGRIDTLFLDKDAKLDGCFYPDTRTLKELHHPPTGQPGDPSHDLIESAAVQTLKHGGRAYCVSADEMPVTAKMAAALRY